MKKRIAIILLAAVVLTLAACGNQTETEPSATAPEQVPETQVTEAVQETQAVTVDADAVYASVAGSYQDSVSQRASLYAWQTEGGLGIRVNWASSASEETEWNMTAVLTEDNKLEYTNGTKHQMTYRENNEVESQEVVNSQQGFFTITDGKLLWNGAADEGCKECVFEPVPEEAWVPEYEGVYEHRFREEIGGTVVDRGAYIILNEDHTGYWIVQAVGLLTWDETHLKQEIGIVNDFTLSQKDGKTVLTVYDFQDENGNWIPDEYVKIDELPADMAQLLAEELAWRENH